MARSGQAPGERGLFASELAAARIAAGLTQEELGERVHFSGSMIGMIETGRRAPTLEMARALDKALSTSGTFERIFQSANTGPLPSWFRPWAEVEAVAAELRLFEHSVVPGLFQTEEYARAVLAVRPAILAEELEAQVAARMARQAVLSRPSGPPLIWALLDESILNRTVGSSKIMEDQLLHLVDLGDRPHVTIQVVPLSEGAHHGLAGAFAIATAGEGSETGYLDTVTDGYIADATAVAWIGQTFNTLRAASLPLRGSQQLIRKRAEDYGPG